MSNRALHMTNFVISWKAKFSERKNKKAFMNSMAKGYDNHFHITHHANFAVIRPVGHQFVYITFYGGHVNCTGIRHPRLVANAISVFKYCFHNITLSNIKIQAIAATLYDKSLMFTPDDIPVMRKKLAPDSKLLIISSRFTGARIRFSYGGSAQLFFSGKVNFLGAKNISHLSRMNADISIFGK